MRNSNTYARSNVMGNDDAATKKQDGQMHSKISTRKEAKWESTVFGDPTQNPCNRRKLGREDNGRGGLYGDNEGSETW